MYRRLSGSFSSRFNKKCSLPKSLKSQLLCLERGGVVAPSTFLLSSSFRYYATIYFSSFLLVYRPQHGETPHAASQDYSIVDLLDNRNRSSSRAAHASLAQPKASVRSMHYKYQMELNAFDHIFLNQREATLMIQQQQDELCNSLCSSSYWPEISTPA